MILGYSFCCLEFLVDIVGLEDNNDSGGRKTAPDLLPDY